MGFVEQYDMQTSTIIHINSYDHINKVIDYIIPSNITFPQCVVCYMEEYVQGKVLK